MKTLVKLVLVIFVLNTISCVAPRRMPPPRRSMAQQQSGIVNRRPPPPQHRINQQGSGQQMVATTHRTQTSNGGEKICWDGNRPYVMGADGHRHPPHGMPPKKGGQQQGRTMSSNNGNCATSNGTLWNQNGTSSNGYNPQVSSPSGRGAYVTYVNKSATEPAPTWK